MVSNLKSLDASPLYLALLWFPCIWLFKCMGALSKCSSRWCFYCLSLPPLLYFFGFLKFRIQFLVFADKKYRERERQFERQHQIKNNKQISLSLFPLSLVPPLLPMRPTLAIHTPQLAAPTAAAIAAAAATAASAPSDLKDSHFLLLNKGEKRSRAMRCTDTSCCSCCCYCWVTTSSCCCCCCCRRLKCSIEIYFRSR